ncbi:TetR/AcrR family transcriptional regulator [Sphaerisporangium sp. TRM90804]|uniref:TetR/AcrR family transcriptional regulator n=1 Tax=Sphaerisporangium sp. TRM90804 TaxID=3031113 RepID=UPI002446B1FB|nr:TetR/AcrR family transcriptional regulator [Sphaerisporangium sp. TRM90804]MDH2426045.1 TetR/AcrR family transcriptional regulator [Sphaerisporangium sp. TRM90804]
MGAERADAKFTAKGLAARARIVEHAAELIYTHGVHGTSNDLLRKASGVSGSQLAHYFPDKESLVLAVIEWQAERILTLHTGSSFAGFDTIDALREWAAFYVSHERVCQEGCTLGSLAAEIVKADLDVRDRIAHDFDRWKDVLRAGLARMRDRGRLRGDADPAELANLLLAAMQGGMLLAQIERDVTPLRDALSAAIDHVQSFEAKQASPPA